MNWQVSYSLTVDDLLELQHYDEAGRRKSFLLLYLLTLFCLLAGVTGTITEGFHLQHYAFFLFLAACIALAKWRIRRAASRSYQEHSQEMVNQSLVLLPDQLVHTTNVS